jgi:hypothetical protein
MNSKRISTNSEMKLRRVLKRDKGNKEDSKESNRNPGNKKFLKSNKKYS